MVLNSLTNCITTCPTCSHDMLVRICISYTKRLRRTYVPFLLAQPMTWNRIESNPLKGLVHRTNKLPQKGQQMSWLEKIDVFFGHVKPIWPT